MSSGSLDLFEVGHHWISSQFALDIIQRLQMIRFGELLPFPFQTEVRNQLKVMISLHKKAQIRILERLAVTCSTHFDEFDSIQAWKSPTIGKIGVNYPKVCENRGWNILMKINSALVGASCIICFNSRGDSVLAL